MYLKTLSSFEGKLNLKQSKGVIIFFVSVSLYFPVQKHQFSLNIRKTNAKNSTF